MRRLNWFVWIWILALAVSGWAQKATDRTTRSLLVNVLDRNGKQVSDLTKDDFRVRVNGKSLTVLNASYTLAPRRVLVLLDISGSMTDTSSAKSKWQIATDVIDGLLRESQSEVPIALLTFSDRVYDFVDFPNSRSGVPALLKQISGKSMIQKRTALWNAVLSGVKLLQPVRAGDSVYVITDGGDNASRVSRIEVNRVLSASGMRLFGFVLAEYRVTTKEEREGPDDLFQVARDSGGFAFGVNDNCALGKINDYPSRVYGYEYNEDTRKKIRMCSQALTGFVNGFYTLEIEVPQLRKDAKIKLEVKDRSGPVRKDIVVTHPAFLSSK